MGMMPEATNTATDDAASTGYAALDQAAKTVADQTGHMAEAGQQVQGRLTEAAADIAGTERQSMIAGARSIADMSRQTADASFDRSHRMLSSTAQIIDIYREAAERFSDRLQALFSAWMTVGRGMQQMQHAWLEVMDDSLASEARKPHDLLRCRSVVEVAEVQRDLYLGAVGRAFSSSSRMLAIAGRTAQEAVRPLSGTH